MSFSESLTRQQLEEITQEWKRTFLCGLEDEQTAPLFVVHTDKGRSEIHYVMPRVELSTGNAFNPYFVLRDKKKKTLFQEYINIKYNLSDPNDQGREKVTGGVQKDWTKKDKKSVRKQIDIEIQKEIQNGNINSRTDTIEQLRAWGFELSDNANNKKHLAIVNPNDPSKNWRLSGAIYQKDFDYSSVQNGNTPPPPKPPEEQKRRDIDVVKKELDYIIGKNSTYNKERYKYVNTNTTTTAETIGNAEDHRRDREQQKQAVHISERISQFHSRRNARKTPSRHSLLHLSDRNFYKNDRGNYRNRERNKIQNSDRVLLSSPQRNHISVRRTESSRMQSTKDRNAENVVRVESKSKSRENGDSLSAAKISASQKKPVATPKTEPTKKEIEALKHFLHLEADLGEATTLQELAEFIEERDDHHTEFKKDFVLYGDKHITYDQLETTLEAIREPLLREYTTDQEEIKTLLDHDLDNSPGIKPLI